MLTTLTIPKWSEPLDKESLIQLVTLEHNVDQVNIPRNEMHALLDSIYWESIDDAVKHS